MSPKPGLHLISRGVLHECMLVSARNLFSVMADIVLEESLEEQEADEQGNWVTALIGFEGACCGLVALHCPETLARRTAAGLLGMAEAIEAQDLFDAMGEVVNILGGDVKLCLDRGGSLVKLSTPSVFMGDRQFQEIFLKGPETVACSMASGVERLLIGVQVNRKEHQLWGQAGHADN